MYVCLFCIALVRKNGPDQFPELKLTINHLSHFSKNLSLATIKSKTYNFAIDNHS